MELTDLVILQRSFIDSNGNKYQARDMPYQYGELPKLVRDNPDFVIPLDNAVVETTEISKSVMDSTERIDALNRPEETKVLEVKPKTVRTTVKTKPVVEEPKTKLPVETKEEPTT